MNAPRDLGGLSTTMETYFNDLAEALDRMIVAGETYTACLSAEASEFVRINQAKVRQPGTVIQRYFDVDLIRGAKHASHRLSLAGDRVADIARIRAAVGGLRDALPELDDDPYLAMAADVRSSRIVRGGPLPAAEDVIEQVLREAQGLDFVGLYAGGPVYRGFASSSGQRNWHEVASFNLQWSLYHRADKAIKAACAGFEWDAAAFKAKLDHAKVELAHIARPPKRLAPGRYRTYLTPAAMEDIAQTLCWGGFSARGLATKQSSLTRMLAEEGGARLDPRLSMREATAEGVAPAFQGNGFTRPDTVALIEAGELVGSLVSPQTAREFSLTANGAHRDEMPESLSIAGGDLQASDALAALGTGLYVGNLHYLNYSDRAACRMTGMTRFGTFWVENGRIVAPIDVLRFDDTIYRMLGENLEALTRETELLLDPGTYHERTLASVRLPGVLLSEMTFTL